MGPRINGRITPTREIPPSAKTQSGSPPFSLLTDSLILLRDLSVDTVKVSVNRKTNRKRKDSASPE